MTTKRQDFWADASEKAEQERNPAAGLFALLAQPSNEEIRAQKRADIASQAKAEEEAQD
jgi:hypothetical protein